MREREEKILTLNPRTITFEKLIIYRLHQLYAQCKKRDMLGGFLLNVFGLPTSNRDAVKGINPVILATRRAHWKEEKRPPEAPKATERNEIWLTVDCFILV